jgi:hypothetical protein
MNTMVSTNKAKGHESRKKTFIRASPLFEPILCLTRVQDRQASAIRLR